MKTSLSLKLLLRIIIAVGLCILLLGFFEFQQTRMTIEQELEHHTRLLTMRLARSLAVSLRSMDVEAIEDIVEQEMHKSNILGVTVRIDEGSRFVIAKKRDDRGRVVNAGEPDNLSAPLTDKAAIVINEAPVGEVTVYISDALNREQLVKNIGPLALRLSLLMLLVTAVLIIFVNILVTVPLMKLNRSCRKMVEGEYDVELDVERNDEIGSLAKSFTWMRDAIREKIVALQDEIAERKRSEQELGRLRSHLKGIVDAIPSILIGVDARLVVSQWNRAAEKATGRSRQECEGRNLMDILPSLASCSDEIAWSIAEKQLSSLERLTLEIGSEARIYDVAVYPVAEDEAEGVIQLDDVTDKVKFEEVMIQTEKMMSVGGLAAGMAHEINNPLAGIMQSVQVIENRISPELAKNHTVAEACGMSLENLECYVRRREIDTMLKSALQSGDRASKIIQNMLTFSRRSTSQYTPMGINDLLERAIALASNDYEFKKIFDFKNIQISREYDGSLPEVRCDGGTIQQVFFNLLKNAAQAIGEAGRCEERHKTEFQPEIRLRTYREKGYVKVDVADNGIGMDTGTRKRIFEPFFTSREVGSGIGLGLSVCFFIVEKNHNGKLEVTSSPDKGTTFTVGLPL